MEKAVIYFVVLGIVSGFTRAAGVLPDVLNGVHEATTSVTTERSGLPMNMENFTLTCVVTGPYDMMYWGVITSARDIFFINDTKELTFTPVTMEDNGFYQCHAINQGVEYLSSFYWLRVIYGPQSVNISGPDSASSGTSVSLTCTANSHPEPDVVWFFNNQTSATGSVLNFDASKNTEGNYTCKATNPVTNITMFQTKVFTLNYASTIRIPSLNSLMLMGLFALSLSAMFN